MLRKVTRTISGVTPVAVMTPPLPCPGRCVYCPTFPEIPRSYTEQSPAVLRASRNAYRPEAQVAERLRTLRLLGHPTDKVELIIMGGTFPALPREFQEGFIKACYDALNGSSSRTLEEAQSLNETSEHRCVGLCIETRPDFCGREEIGEMLRHGATRVELGVQTLDDEIYQLIKRGHTVEDVVQATRRLKDFGFKVYYHWMPGLPGASPEKDLELTERLFSDPRFRPDGLKLYPTLVIRGTELERWYEEGRYTPYGREELLDLLIGIKRLIPKYVRIARVMRDIPPWYIVAGCRDLALRDSLKKRLAELGMECRCIRCREFGHRRRDGRPTGSPEVMARMDYEASEGREVFLSIEDEYGTVFGLLRLRKPFILGPEWAVVRELHTFGPEVPLGSRAGDAVQHLGIGRRLLSEAERIAHKEWNVSRLAVLSGVGAREYYRRLGYRRLGPYMVKELPSS